MIHNIEVICHDHHSVINATMREATDGGCELVSHVKSSGPLFAKQALVVLNLLDTQTGQAMNVIAKLVAVRREEGQWAYKVRWREMPQLLASKVAV